MSQDFFAVKAEGALLTRGLLVRLSQEDATLPGVDAKSFHLAKQSELREEVSRAWNRALEQWRTYCDLREDLPDNDTGTSLTRERWLLPLFRFLDFGRLPTAGRIELDGKSYAVSHMYRDHFPVHLVSFRYDLDKRVPNVSRTSPQAMVQELLNRTDDYLWACVTNGHTLRLLRDNVSLSRLSYVEFDLEAMFEGESFADFRLLYFMLHQSRVEQDSPRDFFLEAWANEARETGTRALEHLRECVEKALNLLGKGFLAHPDNLALRQALKDGDLGRDGYYHELLRIVYRLIFLLVAEDRGMLHPEDVPDEVRRRYYGNYSLSRIRTLADTRVGSATAGDLWECLKVTTRAVHEGQPLFGLSGLGGTLFDDTTTAHTSSSALSNESFLASMRALAFTEEKRVRVVVDFRNLGAEELGSVYESLLELHPTVHAEAAQFELESVASSERKTTGSYYTPTSLIDCLLDSSLNPVIDQARRQENADKAILALKVCDPACGSGHFLVGAAHRIAHALAVVRCGEDEPTPDGHRQALRDVIGHCIYGVDINPMAVELCKVSLWLEALEPGKPLSFLDHHIQCGNSLLGTTPVLMKGGIPDEAFTPIEGDDKAICSEHKNRNKNERDGQMSLFEGVDTNPWEHIGNLAAAIANLDEMDDSSLAGLRAKQQRYEQAVRASNYLSNKLLADAWCAAFVWPMAQSDELPYPITQEVYRKIERNPHSCQRWMRDEIRRISDQYRFFHWHLAFPDVFRVPAKDEEPENEQTGCSGGFDLVLGNPPWELVAADRGQEASRRFAGEQLHFKSNDYAILKGRRDLYKLFFIRGPLLSRADGRVAFLVPFGIFVEDDSSDARRWLFDGGSVTILRHFQNHKKAFFPHVHASYRFCQFVFTPVRGLPHEFSSVARLPDEIANQALFRIERKDFDSVVGESRSAILYLDREYGTLHRSLLAVLLPRSCARFRVVAEFHSSSDKALVMKERKDPADWILLKNRNIHQFDPYFAPPEAFIRRNEVARRLTRKGLSSSRWLDQNPRLVFRDIARNDDERTLIAALVPPGFLSTYDTPMAVPPSECAADEALQLLFFGGAFNSFLFDFLIRPYIDKHIKGYSLNRVPWPTADATETCFEARLVRQCVLELTYTTWDLEPFAKEVKYDGPPFHREDERRFLLRCELDAAFFHLYGIEKGNVDFIMETFPIVKRKDEKAYGYYRTKDTILAMYDAMAEATSSGDTYQPILDPPPGPPADANGNFVPVSQWHTLDPHAISHIHPVEPEVVQVPVEPPYEEDDQVFPWSGREAAIYRLLPALVAQVPSRPFEFYVDAANLCTRPDRLRQILSDSQQERLDQLPNDVVSSYTFPSNQKFRPDVIREMLVDRATMAIDSSTGIATAKQGSAAATNVPQRHHDYIELALLAAEEIERLLALEDQSNERAIAAQAYQEEKSLMTA